MLKIGDDSSPRASFQASAGLDQENLARAHFADLALPRIERIRCPRWRPKGVDNARTAREAPSVYVCIFTCPGCKVLFWVLLVCET